jgi:peptide/nickel transport system substrate-binding protein
VYSVGPSSFDPSKASSSFDNVALWITYDRLVHMSPTGEAVPGLATEWTFGDNNTTLTLKLREGVKFQDGSDLTADVVKANLDRNKAGVSKGDLAAVTSVEVVDPLTVKLNLGAPGGALPLVLTDRAGAIVSAAGMADPGLDLKPSGAGMYKVVEYQKDAKIVYEAWDGYWDPSAVKAKRIEFIILPDNVAAWNAIQSGAADAGLIVPSQVEEAKAADFNVLTGPSLGFFHVQFNRSRPYRDNPEVRKALQMATDTDALIEGIALGKGQQSKQVFPKGYWAHVDALDDPSFLPYDPEKAKQMIKDAGVPEGQKYTAIVPSTNVYPALAEAVKDMWKDVGIELELRPVDSVQTAPIFYSQQEGDVLVSVFGGRADPAQTLSLLFTAGPIQNPGGHTTPEITAAIAKASEPGTVAERTPAVQAATKLVAENAMDVLLYFPEGQTAYTDKVLGLQTWVSSKPEFRGVGVAKG